MYARDFVTLPQPSQSLILRIRVLLVLSVQFGSPSRILLGNLGKSVRFKMSCWICKTIDR